MLFIIIVVDNFFFLSRYTIILYFISYIPVNIKQVFRILIFISSTSSLLASTIFKLCINKHSYFLFTFFLLPKL